jgi:AcrR family transcriptional regulator
MHNQLTVEWSTERSIWKTSVDHQNPSAKEALLQPLAEVFAERGFHGATLTQLAAATGLSKASLYRHFPGGKTEMAGALVRRAVAQLNELAYRHLSREPEETRIPIFVDGFARYTEQGQKPCLLMTLSREPGFATDIHAQTEEWLAQLARAYLDGISEKAAARRARQLLTNLYGALALSQLLGDLKPFRQTVKRLSKLPQ